MGKTVSINSSPKVLVGYSSKNHKNIQTKNRKLDAQTFCHIFFKQYNTKINKKRKEQIEIDKKFSIQKYLGQLGERFVW